MNLDPFFHSKRIAIIGASREPGKVGNTILKQLLGRNFTLFPVNPNADKILGLTCYPSVLDIPEKVELAVISTPGATVPALLDQCGEKGITHVVIVSAGFREIGNTKLDLELHDALSRNKITCIGPNCLGVFDAHTKFDCLFLPKERLKRPHAGGISFISQSGATGSAVLDLSAYSGYGFAKFISYGNAANVDETELLEYLSSDPQTKIICMYVEGITRGKRFLEIASRCKKPVIVIKAGVTEAGGKAALSHTGALAGSSEVYFGAFKQARVVVANSLEEVFEYAKIFEKITVPAKGNRVQVITNGGGYGILTMDAIVKNGLVAAEVGRPIAELRTKFPPLVVVKNPIDLLGDATVERYSLALEAALKDTSNDCLVITTLTQTPLLNDSLVDVVANLVKKSPKPVVCVCTGSEYSQLLKKEFEEAGVACFDFPENAVRALAKYVHWWASKNS